jgi:hypothetical protein
MEIAKDHLIVTLRHCQPNNNRGEPREQLTTDQGAGAYGSPRSALCIAVGETNTTLREFCR